jgi:reverse gyrase
MRLMNLPIEVRAMIWELCLPPGPNLHFFDVANHPRKRHLMHSWSKKEFRIRASMEHDSGYIPIYNMLKTCKDSRAFVKQHYGQLNNCGRGNTGTI